ncbi:hypothetical protein [Dietzia sp. 179-F 9C3 NHS]
MDRDDDQVRRDEREALLVAGYYGYGYDDLLREVYGALVDRPDQPGAA